jgi:formylglycine-generating enzyme required for sulfatase activity
VNGPDDTVAKAARLRLAIEDLIATFGDRYARGREYLRRLNALVEGRGQESLDELRDQALLDNPLLDDIQGLLVLVGAGGSDGGTMSVSAHIGKAIGLVSPVRPGKSETAPGMKILYESKLGPEEVAKYKCKWDASKGSVGFINLHYDARKFLFSAAARNGYQIFEMNVDGSGLRQVSSDEHPYVDNFDPVYMPDGRIVFLSTRMFQGVPCLGGEPHVANLFSMKADGSDVRQLTFEQDEDWDPAVMNDGRVMYVRWEYADTPHHHTRLIFTMNPDGTNQRALMKSNSYWPNAIFYPRPIPNHATRFVGVISGHHGGGRSGPMYVFDPGMANEASSAVVQRIPPDPNELHKSPRWLEESSYDGPPRMSCPKYSHPHPLADAEGRGAGKYFLAGGAVVDVFGNSVGLAGGGAEVVPIQVRPRPPIIPDRTDRTRKDALVYLADIHRGGGLEGVPRGTVKKLRVFEYSFGYRDTKSAGEAGKGWSGPWEPHRIWGTVPVEADGSAHFLVPAMTPLALQPLDAEGKALQVMRSWFVAQPGESISCVGCHERPKDVSSGTMVGAAFRRPPNPIEPWYGPPRGFGFHREVQPVLNKHCAGCHTGANVPKGVRKPNLVSESLRVSTAKNGRTAINPSDSFTNLLPYIHRPSSESDYVMHPAAEFDADASPLIQMLRSGHGGVKLDAESWDRLVTWIDLNAPAFGTWREGWSIPAPQGGEEDFSELRRKMRRLYAGIDDDPESVPSSPVDLGPPVKHQSPPAAPVPDCPGWPFDPNAAAKMQQTAGARTSRRVVLVAGETARDVVLDMALIPAGEFMMGANEGRPDERPMARVKIDRPFWMGTFEITNQQYNLFDRQHDSRYHNQPSCHLGGRGWPMNHPLQPVVRVSWQQAAAFCRWLSEKTGEKFRLPTEAQWEWACRAGSDKPLSFRDGKGDYGAWANMANIGSFKTKTGATVTIPAGASEPVTLPPGFFSWADQSAARPFSLVAEPGSGLMQTVGGMNSKGFAMFVSATWKSMPRYTPNPWGLHNMHGNAAEWTATAYRPYPYDGKDGRNEDGGGLRRVVRGGSCFDLPTHCTASVRTSFRSWQGVHNVGFRVICEVVDPGEKARDQE